MYLTSNLPNHVCNELIIVLDSFIEILGFNLAPDDVRFKLFVTIAIHIEQLFLNIYVTNGY